MVLTSDSSVVSVAVVALAFEPTDVVSEPAGTVLAKGPLLLLVTTTETEQLPPAGTVEPEDRVRELPPVAAVIGPTPQVVKAAGLAAFTNPAGY